MSEVIKLLKSVLRKNFGIFITRVDPKFKNEIFHKILTLHSSVLHIGANRGQEAPYYESLGLKVLWIEADPEVEIELSENLKKFNNQKSIAALLLDEPGLKKEFKVFNNSGISSSIFNLAKNNGFEKLNLRVNEIKILETKTIDELYERLNIASYSHWILDVQGSELLVLKGASKSLEYCKSMTVEVSVRNVYDGGAKYNDVKDYLEGHGFFPLWEPDLDAHCEIVFLRTFKSN
jgi:FkbM family methyltransferase